MILMTKERSVSIEELEQGLPIDEHDLNGALLRQPDLLYKVSKELTLQTSRRDAAKQMLAEVEAEVDAAIRHDAQVNDEKITEKEVASQKILDKDVQDAEKELLRLSLAVGQLGALKEAYQQRSYALRGLIDLYVANYFGDASSPTKTMRTDAIKRQMAEERVRR